MNVLFPLFSVYQESWILFYLGKPFFLICHRFYTKITIKYDKKCGIYVSDLTLDIRITTGSHNRCFYFERNNVKRMLFNRKLFYDLATWPMLSRFLFRYVFFEIRPGRTVIILISSALRLALNRDSKSFYSCTPV